MIRTWSQNVLEGQSNCRPNGWPDHPDYSGNLGTDPLEPLILLAIAGSVPKVSSDGSELSHFAYRERLAKDGADGYGRCINLNKVKRRTLK